MTARRFSGRELVIATHSAGKLSEFGRLFAGAGQGLELTSAADHGLPAPPETGTTFLENAAAKAVFVAEQANLPALADDSGLCVAALGGAPGVYSADWAGEPRDFMKAMRRVHEALAGKEDRAAAFVACLVLAFPDGHCEAVEARAEGGIVWPPRGAGGFGYDPFFLPAGHALTYGEMEPEAKAAISHRAAAFRMMMEKCF